MARPRRRHPALEGIDEQALAEFRAGLRRRYTDDEILAELRASAARLGRSPTMREFAADPEASAHPQTVIEHFGTWNAAKRAAGLTPRRFISREELRRPSCASWGTSSAGSRRPATSRSGGVAWPRSPSSGRRSARSRQRSARRGSTSRSARSAWSGRSRTERCSPVRSVTCRRWRNGRRRGSGTRRSSPSGRSTAWSTSSPAPGRRSSSSCASGCARRASTSSPDGTLAG